MTHKKLADDFEVRHIKRVLNSHRETVTPKPQPSERVACGLDIQSDLFTTEYAATERCDPYNHVGNKL